MFPRVFAVVVVVFVVVVTVVAAVVADRCRPKEQMPPEKTDAT